MNTPPSEDIEGHRKRLHFRSQYRGMKEMDLLMGRFADHHIGDLDQDQLNHYEALLDASDLDVWNWVTGKTEAPAEYDTDVLQKIRDFKFHEHNK